MSDYFTGNYRPEKRDEVNMPPSAPADTPSAHAQQYNASLTKPKDRVFFKGFLGAAIACALFFGGYAIVQDGDDFNEESNSGSQVVLGNTNPSTIPQGSEDLSLAERVAAKALPSVVCINTYASPYSYTGVLSSNNELVQMGLGSGIVLSEDGYIVTNYHVVKGAEQLRVNVQGELLNAEIIGSDPSSDLAVIKASGVDDLVPADLGDSDSLTPGEWVMAIGNPFGLEQSVSTGVVSATSRSQVVDSNEDQGFGLSPNQSSPTIYPNMIQTDAAINPGNSGGALVDSDGKVIGINTLITSSSGDYSGVGFAIPINYALGIAQQIIEGDGPTHAQLGISMLTVDSNNAAQNRLSVSQGAYVAEVVMGSPAYNAGIENGDVIVAFDGKDVTSATDVMLDVREKNPGDKVVVKVNRDGQNKEITVVLGDDSAK